MQDSPQTPLLTTGETETPLRLCVLGTFSLRVQGEEIAGLFRPVQWLLALLILRHSAPLSREWLAETLWPEATQERAAFYLRRSLTEIRTALGSDRTRLASPTRATLQFDVADTFCDVIAFDRLLSAPQEAASLEAAVALYRGDLLAECEASWVLPERARRRVQVLAALENLSKHREGQGDPAGATQLLRRVVEMDPLRETAQRRLMQALGEVGDYIGVERQYRELRHALRDELNIEPAQETVTLYRRLTQEERQPASQSAPDRRVARPDTVRFDNVPRPLGELIGREKEQAEITARLRNERLVTLTGTGGVGKTRLAIATAQAHKADFANGVVWIELAPLFSGVQAAQAIAVALHLSERQGETTLQTLTNYLRVRHVLLILDNCEHLLEPCAELAQELLEACAALHILTTSRQALGLFGECIWSVPPLGTPETEAASLPGQALLQRVNESDAARLFVTRARSVRDDFRVTKANAGSIAQICRQVEGLPLALELAAVWVRSLSPSQIAQRLEDPLTLLQQGDPTADLRHQTLRRTMEWSYGLLTGDEQNLLARLAVFAGGWTLEAMSAVCFENDTDGQALPLLQSLIQKSLVEVRERNEEAWYRLLEPVRQYAWERLREAREEQRLRRRHGDYFLTFAEQLAPLLEGAQVMETMDRMEADYANLRTALRFRLTHSEENAGEHALRLATALSQFQWRRGYYQEGLEGLEEALKLSSSPLDAALCGEAMLSAGSIAFRIGDMRLIQHYAEATETFYRRLPVSSGLVRALRLCATYLLNRENYPAANAILEEGIVLAQQIGDQDNEARLQTVLGISTRLQGDLMRAQTLLQNAVRRCQAASLLADEAVARHNLAVAYVAIGAQKEAKQNFLRSLEIHRQLRNRAWMGANLFDLSRIALLENDLMEARVLCEEALALCRAGNRNVVPLCLQILANVERQMENLSGARAYLEEAFALKQQMDTHLDPISIVIVMCFLLRDEGRYRLGARLLAALVATNAQENTWLPAQSMADIEVLWQDFQRALGEETLTETRLMADTASVDEIFAEALQPGT